MARVRTSPLAPGSPLIEVDAEGGVSAGSSGLAVRDVTAWVALQGRGEKASSQWAAAMRKPVEAVLEDLQRRPARAGALLGPVMDAALVHARRSRFEKFNQTASQWLAILVNPSLWHRAVKALWEGEEVWSYLEARSAWYEISEAVLLDANNKSILGRAESSIRRHHEDDTPLEQLITVPYLRVADSNVEDAPAAESSDASQVLVFVGVHCQLAVRLHGTPSEQLRPTLQALCEEADLMLERSSIDPHARSGMIERLLKRALVRTSPAASPWTWPTALFFGAMGAVLIFGAMLHCALREHQWQKALDLLAIEPGLHILRESSSWGRREVSGIRDPMAREPAEVLAAAGVPATDIEFSFKTYLSADPPFALVREALEYVPRPPLFPKAKPPAPKPAPAPSPVTAPAPEPAPAPVPKPTPATEVKPGLKPYDYLMELKHGVEAIEFHFEATSDTPTPESATALSDAARRLAEMQTIAEQRKLSFHLAMKITQTAGSPEGAIWQLRHSHVRDALTAKGVRAAAIEPTLITPASSASPSSAILDGMNLRLTLDPKPASP